MYYLLFAVLYLLSLLPFWLLYLVSDGIFLLLYYVFRYRRQVVMNNLHTAFPEKSPQERTAIAKAFYRNFIDNFIETLKLLSMSRKVLNQRFTSNYEVIEQLYATGKSVQVHLGHFFNWELANAVHSINTQYPFLVIYMPIKNKPVDRLFRYMRQRFGTHLLAATTFRREFIPYSKSQYCLVMVGDQNPGEPQNAYWLPFFGKMTPIVKGPEKGARLGNAAVVMGSIHKVKRGYYRTELTLLTTDPRSLPDGEITRQMIWHIEEVIRKSPANYLWSHRRWKWAYHAEKHAHLVIG